jgi:hypothetical protein
MQVFNCIHAMAGMVHMLDSQDFALFYLSRSM